MSAAKICRTRIGLGVIAATIRLRRRRRPHSGPVIHDREFGSDYCLDLQDGTSLEIAPPYRYLNHSCLPNCELVLWEFQPWLHTLASISPGDELTIDYAWPRNLAILCRCAVPPAEAGSWRPIAS